MPFLDRKDLPSAGQAPIVGLAPAIGNALFDATRVRLRPLPLVPDGLKIDAEGARLEIFHYSPAAGIFPVFPPARWVYTV